MSVIVILKHHYKSYWIPLLLFTSISCNSARESSSWGDAIANLRLQFCLGACPACQVWDSGSGGGGRRRSPSASQVRGTAESRPARAAGGDISNPAYLMCMYILIYLYVCAKTYMHIHAKYNRVCIKYNK